MKTNKLLVIIILLALFFTGCINDKKDTVKIGVIMPLTGPVAEPGTNANQGILLAIEQYNAFNEKKIELIIEDSKSNPKDGVAAMNKLVSANNVKLVIGDIMSSVFLACAPIAEKNKIVMISPGASNPSVRDAGDYIFRDYLSDDFDGKVMANYLYQNLNKKNVAIISVNNDYGNGVEKVFLENYNKLGGNVALQEKYEQGQTSFKSIMLKIKNSNPDVLYIVGNPSENGYIVKELKENNIKIPITGNLSFENEEFIKIAKNAFDSIIFSSPYFDLDSDKQFVKSFKDSYLKKYGKLPDIAAALGFDVANILIMALKNNGYDQVKVKDYLYLIKNYDGITGMTSFDENGDVMKDIFIKSIYRDTKIQKKKHIF